MCRIFKSRCRDMGDKKEDEVEFKIVDEMPNPLFEINTKGEFILRGEVIAVDKEVANKIIMKRLGDRERLLLQTL